MGEKKPQLLLSSSQWNILENEKLTVTSGILPWLFLLSLHILEEGSKSQPTYGHLAQITRNIGQLK